MADNVTITPTVQTITVTPAGGTTTTITPAATQTVTITQSASISSAIDTTDALTEGSTNLYFTNARASAAAPIQTLTMPTGYSVLDSSGDLSVTVTNASSVRTGIGADDASNLSTGTLNNDRLSNVPVSKLTGTLQNAQVAESNVTQHATAVAAAIDLGDLANVNIPILTNGQVLTYNLSTDTWVAGSSGSGTVTSVGLTVPSGLSVSGSPVTSSGTLAVTTTLNGIVKGDGSGFSAATAGVDYANASHTHSVSDLTSGSLSISLTPDTDQAYNLGTEDYRWGTLHGDVEGSILFRAKNGNAGALAVGDVVYISGYTSGETPDVDLADADDSAKMPAFGIVSTGGNSGAEVHVTTFGTLAGLDLNPATYSAGDAIYVSTTAGDFTNSPPTGESSALQKIGVVIKPNTGGGTNGSVRVLGAGRTNATPNLNSGNIFYGNGSNQAVATALTSVAEAAGAVSTHSALTSGVHGISAFGATLIDDADATAARTTLGAAATNHNHSTSQITSGTFDDARIASSNVTQHAGDIDIGDLGNVTTGLLSDNLFLAYSTGSSAFTGRAPAAARTALGLGSLATQSTITDSYVMMIEAPSDKTYYLDPKVIAARTITTFYAITSAGTCTALLKQGGLSVGSIAVTTSGGTASVTNTSVSANAVIQVDVSSTSSAEDLQIMVGYTQ